jgi:hypothetical protein
MSQKTPPKINVRQLLQLLEESGFDVTIVGEKRLIEEAAKPSAMVRARTAVAAPVKIKGLILPDQYRILVNRELGLEERVKTVLHELIHLQAPDLSESVTERQTLTLYKHLTPNELGQLEFLVS